METDVVVIGYGGAGAIERIGYMILHSLEFTHIDRVQGQLARDYRESPRGNSRKRLVPAASVPPSSLITTP